MVKTIRLGEDNYFVGENGSKVMRYTEGLDLVISKDDGSTLLVDNDHVTIQYGGQIVVQHNEDRYIVDDGYQNELIKAGYVVYDNYDKERIEDRNFGSKINKEIKDKIKSIITSQFDNVRVEQQAFKSMVFTIESEEVKTTIVVDTVQNIIEKNQNRKDNSLVFYPFDKNMDRYGTVYVSIFMQRKAGKLEKKEVKLAGANKVINELIRELGEKYHYVNTPVKKRLLYWKDL